MSISLDVMHSRPGIYLIVSPGLLLFVEVDEAGVCHQLKPETFERDGIMEAGRWIPQNIGAIFGPLSRPRVPVTDAEIDAAATKYWHGSASPEGWIGYEAGARWALEK